MGGEGGILKQPSERRAKRTGAEGCAGELGPALSLPLPSSISISLSFSSLAIAGNTAQNVIQ